MSAVSAAVDHQSAAPDASRWRSLDHLQTWVLLAATTLSVYLCYLLAVPFLPALALALALAVLFMPLQRWLEAKLKRVGLAAAVTVLIIALSVGIPAGFVGQQLAVQAVKGSELVEAKIKSGEWRRSLEGQPRMANLADWIERQIDLPGVFKTFAAWLSTVAALILKGSILQLVGICLTFYLLFYFLRDRELALRSLKALSPLSEVDMERLFSRVGDTIYATIYGMLAVSFVQGFLGGLMFWWLGLSAPVLWGTVMALLAIVPVLGAFVVWLPAAIFLALEGSWQDALILCAWGGIVVGTADNLLRPILVGSRLRLHTVLAFMSVVGGLILFGPAGLILGPVGLTISTVLLEIWRPHSSRGAPEGATPAAQGNAPPRASN